MHYMTAAKFVDCFMSLVELVSVNHSGPWLEKLV
jgi:hypothetical protein